MRVTDETKSTNTRWLIIVLAFLGTAVSYVDRGTLGSPLRAVSRR